MSSRRNFIIVGIILSLVFAIKLFSSIMTESFSFMEILLWGTLAYIPFALAYLYPQFKQNDERTKFIRQKGMFVSFILTIVYFIVITFINKFDIIILTTQDLIQLLISLVFITIFSSFLILAKKH
ncbi:MAG: hypothetical protein ACQEW5_28290 [Bacillota bacterium]|uniref:Permease n=1 Tax=Peribacillus simplex TaxID=1478 RepID=A0A9X8ZGT6_9BACI|nr:hypothetical protein [Peribacillus simplex]TKH10673.1 hypothetical protein FC678_14125 [Peribacillus simplex]